MRMGATLSSQPETIKPKPVPLSHAGAARPERRSDSRKLVVFLFLAFAAVLVVALFAWVPQLLAPQPISGVADKANSTAEANAEAPDTRSQAAANANQPPPFEALRREQARTEAQDELARFVEREIELRETLSVEGWADAALEAAKERAHEGDEAFVGERYPEAIEQYRAAADALAALIADGQNRFAQALAEARQAVRERNPAQAETWLATAREIKPEHPELLALAVRAGHLPEILNLFREAHNQELAGEWKDAIATYAQIRTLDPATPGLDRAMANARAERAAQRLQSLLSAGFAHLSNGRLDKAQAAFNGALSLAPQNGAALGGLQQVEEQRLVQKIERLRADAAQAASREDWPAAITAFEAILSLDANIQFARGGLAEARLQTQTLAALHGITDQSDALSSDRRYAAARESLARAEQIEPRGPILAKAIAEAQALLDLHATPVPVTLQSDNATDVLISNIGPLGTFSEMRLDLRPGAYTLVGSRDGCRDVRTTITVHTGMPPVDIRCQEVLAR